MKIHLGLMLAVGGLGVMPAWAADEAAQTDLSQTEAIADDNSVKGIIDRTEGSNLPEVVPSATTTANALERKRALQEVANIDITQLKQDPLMFTKVLNTALAAQDLRTVKRLLPEYRRMAANDPMLIQFADAMLYRSEGNQVAAINIYRGILAQNPDYHPVRLNLAATLYADKQYKEAKQHYQKLLDSPEIPEPVLKGIRASLDRVKRTEDWKFSLNASVLRDDNVNNVPTTPIPTILGGIKTPEPKSVKGVQVNASASKRYNLHANYYTTIGLDANTKTYDDSDYNDYSLTASTAIGFDDADTDMQASPFVTKRFYQDEAYSTRAGVNLSVSEWLTPSLRGTANAQLAKLKHDDQSDSKQSSRYLDANTQFYGVSALYTLSPKQYVFAGANYYDNNANNKKTPDNDRYSYDIKSLNVGWGKAWLPNLSTRITGSYSTKQYDKADPVKNNFYNEPDIYLAREDDTVGVDMQIWNQSFDILGLTPKLELEYSKTDSNLKYYDNREKKSATIALTKNF